MRTGNIMDEVTRQLISEAIALDDATNEDNARWEAKQVRRPREMIFKTHESPTPVQQQSVATRMSEEASAPWKSWINDHLDEFAEEIDEQVVKPMVAAHKKLHEEIVSLRSEVEVLRAMIKGNVASIKQGKSDAA